MTAFTNPAKPERISAIDQLTLAAYRDAAREQSLRLGHKSTRFSNFRIANGHPTTVAACEKCGAEISIVLYPADGSYPVQGAAVTNRCQK